jgi:DNA-binding NtrC family response regulator
MKEQITALLVHQNSDTMMALKSTLEAQGMRVVQAGSRAAAKKMLGGLAPYPLVFTDAHLPDGTWVEVLAAAEKAKRPVNVIVVARVVDTRFYVQAIETGAFDFIAPPFNATDLAYIVRSALDNVLARRALFGLTGATTPAKPLGDPAPASARSVTTT